MSKHILRSRLSIRNGDIFLLGKHRLLCGDSRNVDDVKLLIGRRKVTLVFAGPPYYNQRSYSRWRNYAAYIHDMTQVMDNCIRYLKSGGIMAWQIGRGAKEQKDHIGHLSVCMSERQLKYQYAIAWIKPSGNYSIKRSCHILRTGFYYPSFRWEVILVYRKPGGQMSRMSMSDRKYMSDHHVDVWEIPWVAQQLRRYGHPSVAPLEIPRRCIRAYSRKGNNVYEPFGGSGTTLIAAEETQRTCMLMERKPQYCRSIINRWEQLTGQKAVPV